MVVMFISPHELYYIDSYILCLYVHIHWALLAKLPCSCYLESISLAPILHLFCKKFFCLFCHLSKHAPESVLVTLWMQYFVYISTVSRRCNCYDKRIVIFFQIVVFCHNLVMWLIDRKACLSHGMNHSNQMALGHPVDHSEGKEMFRRGM